MPTEVNENSGFIGNTGSNQKIETVPVIVETFAQKQEKAQGHTSQQQTQMWENVESKYAELQREYKSWMPNKNETGDFDKLFFLAYKAITFKPIARNLKRVPNRVQAAEIARYYLSLVDMSKVSTYFSQEIHFSPDNWLSLVKQGRGLDSNGQPLLFVSDYAELLYKAACEILNDENTNQNQWRYALDVLELLTKCDNKYRELTHLILARSILHDKADDFLVRKENIHPSTSFDHQTKQKLAFEINEKRYEYCCKHIKELPLWGCDESILSGFVKEMIEEMEMTLADVVMITDHLHQEDQKASRQYDLNKFLRIYFKIVDIKVLKADRAANQIVKIIAKIGCGNFYEVLNQIGAIQEVSFIDLLRDEKSDTERRSSNQDRKGFLNQIKSFNEKKSLLGLNLLYNVKHLQDLGDDEIRNVLSWLREQHIEFFCEFVVKNIKDTELRSRISGLILSRDSLVAKLSAKQKDKLIEKLFLSKEDVKCLRLSDPYSNAKLGLRIFNETKDEKDIKRFEEILGILSFALNDLKKLNEKDESYSKKAEYYSLKLALEELPEGIKNPKSKSVMSLLVLQRSEIHEHLLDRSSLSKLVNNLQAKELEQFKKPEQNLAKIILKNDRLREKYELVHKSEEQKHNALINLFKVAWTQSDLIKEVIEFICNNTLSETCANAFVEWILQQQDAFKEQILRQLLCEDYYVNFNRIIVRLSKEVLLNLMINVAKIENTNEILKKIVKNISEQKASLLLLSDIFNEKNINQFNEEQLIELFFLYKELFKPNLGELLNMFFSSLTYVDLRSMIENYIWENYTFDNLSQGLLDENLRDGIANFICSDMNVANINKRINFISKLLLQPKSDRNVIFKNIQEERFSNSYKEYKGRISLILLKLRQIIMNSGLGKLIEKVFGKKNELARRDELESTVDLEERVASQQGHESCQPIGQEKMPDQHVNEVDAVIGALEKINGYLTTPKTRLWSWRKSKTLPIKQQIYSDLQTSLLEKEEYPKNLKQQVENKLGEMDRSTRKTSKVFRGLVIDALDKVSEVSSPRYHDVLRSRMATLFEQQNKDIGIVVAQNDAACEASTVIPIHVS